ncbi:hypothetical protein [Desulfolutivibrio sulfoxidireducens]|uniref:hypothetical protein n=1 Tax=Desulfolutivibrio sulfoxidireducens TaxID=2773299 RepID=UPI00159E475C|nr:hypothetical protein [Desulfolutivibrio sulfoxidireducens]QLA21267.1 hypothetical protein GD604_16825 [Desulfolutivibrio sulfoxidireducens]
MAIAATYLSSVSFSVAGDLAEEFAPGSRVKADCGGDGDILGTVTSSAASGGSTTVVVAVDAAGALTANLTGVLHGNDVPDSLCGHAAQHAAGGRDALSPADIGAAEATAVKGLISTNTTIYVAVTGSDTTGDGSSGAPFASIARALAFIADALIAADASVTIQVADGTYQLTSAVNCGHPDASRITIQGNVSAETSLAVATIDAANKTFTLTGDYAALFPAGDVFRIVTGAEANKGVYSVASASVAGGVTSVVVNEAVASDAPGGASVVVMPCNRCVLQAASTINAFTATNSFAASVSGFRVESPSNTAYQAFYPQGVPYWAVRSCVVVGFRYAVHCGIGAFCDTRYIAALSQATNGLRATMGTVNTVEMAIGGAGSYPIVATQGAFIRYQIGGMSNNGGSNAPSPTFTVVGNNNSYITNA